jgi:putative intracellular protease/amidase
MKIFKISFIVFLLSGIFLFNACKPLQNLNHPPAPWTGKSDFKSKMPDYEASNKNVFIVADAKLTVLFDMLAPFYLFNSTGKANVYIIAKDKTPILIKRNLFVLPQITFEEADSMKLPADVIVIPALSRRDENQDTIVIGWIKAHFSSHTKILAVCDGASTAAATGLYDGKPLTCHASDYEGLKAHFNKPNWVQNVAVTQSGNLFSTAGVSNAVEGSLTVINELFGRETMLKVLGSISYPAAEIKTNHISIAVNGANKFSVAKKIIFRRNKELGLLMENGINEFDMASILETYGRTMPASFTAINLKSSTTLTKNGLTLVCTGNPDINKIDEWHILVPSSILKADELTSKRMKIIRYDKLQGQYLLNTCLDRIGEQFGGQFENFVKISLDYN